MLKLGWVRSLVVVVSSIIVMVSMMIAKLPELCNYADKCKYLLRIEVLASEFKHDAMHSILDKYINTD